MHTCARHQHQLLRIYAARVDIERPLLAHPEHPRAPSMIATVAAQTLILIVNSYLHPGSKDRQAALTQAALSLLHGASSLTLARLALQPI